MNQAYQQISKKANIILHIILIIMVIACIIPLLLVISVSFTDEMTISQYGYRLIPKKFSIDAYAYVFKDVLSVLRAYGNTILVTVVGTFFSVTIMAIYAYPLSRKEIKYRRIFNFIVYFTMLFNGGLVPWYMVYIQFLHLKNNYLALIIPMLVQPMYVLVLRTFFITTIPESVIESARIDGSSEIGTFFRIVVPLAKPPIASIALFSMLFYWNDWYLPLMFTTDEKKFTLQYLLYRVEKSIQYLSQNSSNFSNASEALSNIPSQSARMAMAVIAIGPIIFAYPYFQKYFVKGLVIGSIKG